MNAYNFDSLAVLPTRTAVRMPKGKQHPRRAGGKREAPVIMRERHVQEARKAKVAYAQA